MSMRKLSIGAARQEIDKLMSHADIEAAYVEADCRFVGNPRPNGFYDCHDLYTKDEHPSAGVNLNSGVLNRFKDDANKKHSICFWEVMHDKHPQSGSDQWEEDSKIVEHFGKQFDIEVREKEKAKPIRPEDIIAIYDYVNSEGETVHQTVRYKTEEKPKNFTQRRPNPEIPNPDPYNMDDYIRSIKETKEKGLMVPYNLPGILRSQEIYLAEGEKAADCLNDLGEICASCVAEGARNYQNSVTQYFKDKDLIILPDCDISGEACTSILLKKLFDVAKSIKVVKLPGLPSKGDVFDWLEDGHTLADLKKLAAETPAETSYTDPVLKLNNKHAVVVVQGKTLILNEKIDPIFKRQDIDFSSIGDFRNRYSNVFIPNTEEGIGQPKEVPITKAWLQDTNRRQYNDIVFDPTGNCPEDCYNLFKGFGVEPKKGDWRFMKYHLRNVVCSGVDDYFDYLMAWMARTVQDPGGERPGVAVVLRGKRGVGKGAFVDNFGPIFGRHFLHLHNQQHFTGRFNSHLKDTLLAYIDEGFWAGDKSAEGVLKGMITDPITIVESKYVNPFQIELHCNLVIASNEDWVIPAGELERRFFMLDVSSKKRGHFNYFKRIYQQMTNNGGIAAMLHDLLEYDISEVELKDIPRTDALLDQILISLKGPQKFWHQCLVQGELPCEDMDRKAGNTWPEYVLKRLLYEEYVQFEEERNNHGRRATKHEFQQMIWKWIGGTPPKGYRGKRREITCHGRDEDDYCYGPMPSVEECRTIFEETIGQKVPWEILDDGDITGDEPHEDARVEKVDLKALFEKGKHFGIDKDKMSELAKWYREGDRLTVKEAEDLLNDLPTQYALFKNGNQPTKQKGGELQWK